jgi:hypothetical protein
MSRARTSRLTRRRVLGALAATGALGLAPGARAIGPGSLVGIGHLKHGGDWNHRPEALRRVLWETGRRTSIDVARDATVVSLKDDALFGQPLLVLTGTEPMPAFSDEERAALLRHLRFGGLLWVDAPSTGAPFLRQCLGELDAMLGDGEVQPLPRDHVMFKSFFLLDKVVGRTADDTSLRGATLQGRTSVLVTACDVLGALERDRFGTWRFECMPGGESQRERAMRFAVNVMMYATCLDYKTDQVHIPFIMKKKRR